MSREARSLTLSRRQWLRLAAAGVLVGPHCGWLKALAVDATASMKKRSCILLWMNGGPSQIDTFDMKPGHPNGGEFKPIATAVPGIHISEHLPKLAAMAGDLAIIRSMSTKEGDHGRATYLLRTGYPQLGQVQYPTLGSLIAKENGDEHAELPSFVSIAPYRLYNQAAFGPGFLGYDYAPLIVGESGLARQGEPAPQAYERALKVKDLEPAEAIDHRRADRRFGLMDRINREFANEHPGDLTRSHQSAFERAIRLMRSQGIKAFDLDEEPASLRDAYGRNGFGQGCLLARRLVERGVPFVEVTLDNVGGVPPVDWDTHRQNFDGVKRLSDVLDPAWSTLLSDLRLRGLFASTTIVWMGEFGRTPKINADAGRDHAPNAWTAVLAGGGIKGGQVIGRTSADGTTVADRPVSVGDLIATVCRTLNIDVNSENASNVGRTIRIVPIGAKPIEEVLV